MSWVQKKLNQGFGIAALVISSLAGSGCVYELITPPKILPKNGQEIPILVNNLYKGTARTDYNRKTNRYYITYNSARMSTIHPDAQLFIYFYEEGHLEGDHLGLDDEGNEIFVDKKLYRQHDKEADCYSGKKVRDEYHYTPQQFENVYDYLRNHVRNLDREEAVRLCVAGREEDWAKKVYPGGIKKDVRNSWWYGIR